jgi:hypothetical protein
LLHAAVAVVVAGATPALALDATGVWSGRWSCRQNAGGAVTSTRESESTMLITHRGELLFLEIDGTRYDCRDSDTYTTRATGAAVRCTTERGASTRTAEVLDLRIRIHGARGTARISGRSTVDDARGRGRCRYRFSRTSRADPGVGPLRLCGDGNVNDAPNEECDGAATGTPCDGACTSECTCPTSCEHLDVSGHWEGTWVSAVTGESGPVVANLAHEGYLVFGSISFPPFGDQNYSPPFLWVSPCAPAEFSSGAILSSGVGGSLEGVATNSSLAGSWRISDGSDHGTWALSR